VSRPVFLAGAAYFAIVFAAGFLMGMLRILFVAPSVGEITAVILELPIMLAVAWFACSWVLSKFHVPQKTFDRLVMGAIALILLLIAEAMLALGLSGLSPQQHLASYTQAGPLIGLAAQLLYAGFPVIRAQAKEDVSGA
jgi:ABC-type uncharacterized transport system permease subunit